MRTTIFVASNWVIVLGYVAIALYIAPFMDTKYWYTKVGGAVFFATCAMTHLEMVTHALTRTSMGFTSGRVEWHMIAIHIVQAVSVFVFIFGLYKEFVSGQGSWLRVLLKRARGSDRSASL